MLPDWRRSKRGNFWKPLERGALVVFRKEERFWGWLHERGKQNDRAAPCFGDGFLVTLEGAERAAERHLAECRGGPDTLR